MPEMILETCEGCASLNDNHTCSLYNTYNGTKNRTDLLAIMRCPCIKCIIKPMCLKCCSDWGKHVERYRIQR